MKKENKIVLITGASSGIGKACAHYLSRKGHTVYGTSRNAPAEGIAQSNGRNGPFIMLKMDVWDTDSVKDAIRSIYEKEGRLDVVVNNAGISIQGAVEDMSVDEFKQEFETNLFGPIRICQAALPIMREQRSGYIVNVSSLAGQIGIPFDSGYSASKFALEGLTETLRMEVKPFGINVVLIEPGDTCTGMSSHSLKAANALKNPTYQERFERADFATQKNEKNGSSPETIAVLLGNIISNPSPRLRYVGGSAFDKVILILKKFIPSRLFEYLVMKTYNIT